MNIVKSADTGDFSHFDHIAEPANRITIALNRVGINELEKLEYRSGTSSLQILDENYVKLLIGMIFKDFSPFFETFNEVLGWLESNGMMEKLRQDSKILRREPEKLGPQILTIYQLRLGFLACLIVAALSFAAFFGELMWSRLIVTFQEKMQKAVEEKWEIATGNVDDNHLTTQYDLIEVQFIGE